MLERLMKDTFKTLGIDHSHTLGAFFRLWAHRIITMPLEHLLYIDTDVVIMANLEGLLRQVESRPNALFHWGEAMCSGFVVMNFQRMDEIWTLAKSSNIANISKQYSQRPNDQLIYQAVNVTYPQEINILESGWDMAVAVRWRDKQIEVTHPNLGMLHFNGGGSKKDAYFGDNKTWINMEKFQESWGNARYYVTLPWAWARYQSRMMTRPGSDGHMLNMYYWGESRYENATAQDRYGNASRYNKL